MYTICKFTVSCPTDEDKRRLERHLKLQEPIQDSELTIRDVAQPDDFASELCAAGFAYKCNVRHFDTRPAYLLE